MTSNDTPGTETLSVNALEDVIAAALEASQTGPANARSTARALTQAEIDGQKGHGLARVESYAAQANAGKVDGYAEPSATRTRPGALMVDVKHGFVYPAVDLVINQLPDMARENGIAAAALTRSHHFGVAGRHVERLAEMGLVALAVTNTPKAIAPWGGRHPLFGTNPIAFAAPRPDANPVVIDMAVSQVARGKILTAAQRGDAIPDDWAVDETGAPTTDAQAAMKGSLRPMGGAKGAALAMLVEILSVALTGARSSAEASSFFDADGPPPGVGQSMIAIDPGAFAGSAAFGERIAALALTIEDDDGARLPGSRRLTLRAQAARDGVTVDAVQLANARQLAAQ